MSGKDLRAYNRAPAREKLRKDGKFKQIGRLCKITFAAGFE